MFETYRQAHFSKEAVYRLPYSVAEGFAAKHRIPRDEFLARIAKQMTASETLRMQRAATKQGGELEIDLTRAPLTRLAIYVAALKPSEREARAEELDRALGASAARAFARSPLSLGRVAAVLDRSYSSSGTTEKRRRPLAVAVAASYLLRRAASKYRAFWTPALPQAPDCLALPQGQTDLAGPLIEALRWGAELVVIVSDGYENAPSSAVQQVVSALRERVPGGRAISIVHLNPVFASDHFAPKTLGHALPTVGIPDAEDLLTMIGFARFAEGTTPLAELESYLAARMATFLDASGDGS